MQHSRRDFLKKTGMGITSTLIGSSLLSACTDLQKPKGQGPFANIGLQLYTLRDLLNQDPKLTLETVAKIGYSHIETYGLEIESNSFWKIKIPDLSRILTDNNLKTHSGHYDLSKYLSKTHTDKENVEKYIEIAHALGQKYIIAPVSPMFDINALQVDDYKYAAEQLNKAGEMAKKAGMNIGFHNHFWEFRAFPNGTRGLDILLAFTEPDLVSFEMDIFWIEKAGLNPLTYFKKYPKRFPLWHVKDMDKGFTKPIIGEDLDKLPFDSLMKEVRFTEVGTGNINYPTIVQGQGDAGLEFAYVEQDQIYQENKFKSVEQSYDYVQRLLTK